MTKLFRYDLILVSVVLSLACYAERQAPRAPASEVLPPMIQELFDALPADAGVWERHLADDALFVGEEGKVYTKAELLKDFGPFPEGLKGSIKVQDPRVVEHGDLAVVTFDLVEDEQVFDQKIRVLYFGSRAWRFQDGRWRLVLAQSGVRAQDPPPVPAAGVRLADYGGTYVVGPWRYKVEARGSELWAGREGRDAKRLIAVGDNVFVEPGDPLSILRIFARGPDGRVDRMIERRKSADLTWKRQ